MEQDSNNREDGLYQNQKIDKTKKKGLFRRRFLQIMALLGGVGATFQNEKMIVEAGRTGRKTLTVDTGEIYHIPSGVTEQYSRVDVDGTLQIDGELKIAA